MVQIKKHLYILKEHIFFSENDEKFVLCHSQLILDRDREKGL